MAYVSAFMAHRAPVVIVPYSEEWPIQFEAERIPLAAIFGGASKAVQHIGSTAVPNLAAKPIIDNMVGVPTLDLVETRVEAMNHLGYEYLPQHEKLMPERRFFAKPVIRPRRFHVHVVDHEGAFWNRHVAFRDALRADHQLASTYASLKIRLAAEFGEDRNSYANAKSPFITAVISNAIHGGAIGLLARKGDQRSNPTFRRTASPPLNWIARHKDLISASKV